MRSQVMCSIKREVYDAFQPTATLPTPLPTHTLAIVPHSDDDRCQPAARSRPTRDKTTCCIDARPVCGLLDTAAPVFPVTHASASRARSA